MSTTIESGAQSLPRFAFQLGDVVVLGNDYDGLSAATARLCGARLRIPMADVWTPKPRSSAPIDPARVAAVARDGLPNLNVAMASSIICYQWFCARAGLQSPS